MKNSKGITLTSLIVTIIVMVILAGIALLFSVGEEGIIERANESKRKTELAEFKEKVGLEYLGLKNNNDKPTSEVFGELKDKMLLNTEFEGNECMIIKYDEETYITLFKDGRIIDGKKAMLNIADGSIDIKENGYIQGKISILGDLNYALNGTLIKYNGDYIITGTSTENTVRVMEKGKYNITIKDLNIKSSFCAFNANRNGIPTDVFVNLYIEGENHLEGMVGVGFAGATPNINGVTNGSTLTIQGDGSLFAKGGYYSAGIGSGYTGYEGAPGDANNIIINSANITTVGASSGCGIGAARYKNANNIIINGGNINASTEYGAAIGAFNGTLDNLVINGGNITGTCGGPAGIISGSNGSGEVVINGGNLNFEKTWNVDAVIGEGCKGVIINGGVINTYSEKGVGIGNTDALPFKLEINGGEINIDDRICSTPVNLSNENWYLTKFKIGELAKQLKVDKVQTNNNIEYEIENLYTMTDGHLYMFLPEGEVTVTVITGGTTYTGTVTVTPENTEVFVLN